MFNFRSVGNLVAGTYCAAVTIFLLLSVGQSTALAASATPTPVVSQSPLSVGGDVPGNLLLTPSVEHPTVNSVANLGSYSGTATFVGYFDSAKCYTYYYDATEANRYFYATSLASTTNHSCTGALEWSGSFLNWAATQTIDPFRKALTGGLRVRDTTTETWLEKARSDGNASNQYYPNRTITGNATLIAQATPASWTNIYIRVANFGNRMVFASTNIVGTAGTTPLPTTTAYTGTTLTAAHIAVYEVNVRVKVCDTAVSLESNCVGYPSASPTHYKPEGLIQKYSDRIRYSAFGYLNDSTQTRDGGVLRARQKFVGPYTLSFNSTNGWVESDNTAKEWDADTGVLIQNPDATDANSTTTAISGGSGYVAANHAITNSGVINYINKFGQMTTANHKGTDPVSELYYAALRYLKNQGNVPAYTNLSGTAATRYQYADGFPVITNWTNPVQYACQNNAFLGIGDVYTHVDKNLPGNTNMTLEPTRPAEVSADSLNVTTLMQKVWEMEFGTTSYPIPMPQGATSNSPYIAALAYHAHTTDLSSAFEGLQTASTYWVDVRENQTLQPPGRNQYWLASKYGGFTVPDDFNPLTATALPAGSWESDETITANDSVARPRPENFYVASQAQQMIESLTRAFAKIAAESRGSASSLAANSTRLDTETRTFQAQFLSGIWGGELNAYSVDEDGELSTDPVWNATEDMMAGASAWSTRNILLNTDADLQLESFLWTNLTAHQQSRLLSANVVNYLRGERANEESYTAGTLRVRGSVLGDIVNSTPLFIGAPNATLHSSAGYAGASTYQAWATDAARLTRTPMVYVGANDGMLHAFNANNGAEVFAFIPNSAIDNNLSDYSDPLYEHKYFVDGETAAAEIYDTATSSWRTILIGSLGRGGPGIFALDVTVPANPSLLWELDADDIPQLGKNLGRPVIAQVASGDWRVFLGNGPDSGDGAYMISVRLGSTSNGDIAVYATDTSSTNGMTALLLRDTDSDTFADTAYAGDLEGAVWKIGNIGGTPTSIKLFQTADSGGTAQPITAAPLVGRDPNTGYVWVFFGTGKYLNEDDLSDTSVQTWYGIIDSGTTIAGRSELVERSILLEVEVAGIAARVIEAGAATDMVGRKGWYMDLVSPGGGGERGERMVVPNRFQGQTLIGTTRIPEYTDACSPGGSGYVMAISPFTGARLVNTFFDMNGDGMSNDSDKYCISASNCVPISAVGFDSSPNNPIFIENVMQVGLDDGSTETMQTFGSSVEASRMSWRELFNN